MSERSPDAIAAKISCLVPARNESGHLYEVIEAIRTISDIDEIIIIEGGSSDDTWSIAVDAQIRYPRLVKSIQQEGKGKFDAVLTGAGLARNTLVMIWDADGTVPLIDSLGIVNFAVENQCAVIGNRLLGKIQPGAMRVANYLGNWAFALIWAPLLGSWPKDMLCGTKIFPREVFVTLPNFLKKIDPYGDFALVAHALKLKVPVKSRKVDYNARTYGETNIHRWSGGLSLLRVSISCYRYLLKK